MVTGFEGGDGPLVVSVVPGTYDAVSTLRPTCVPVPTLGGHETPDRVGRLHSGIVVPRYVSVKTVLPSSVLGSLAVTFSPKLETCPIKKFGFSCIFVILNVFVCPMRWDGNHRNGMATTKPWERGRKNRMKNNWWQRLKNNISFTVRKDPYGYSVKNKPRIPLQCWWEKLISSISMPEDQQRVVEDLSQTRHGSLCNQAPFPI